MSGLKERLERLRQAAKAAESASGTEDGDPGQRVGANGGTAQTGQALPSEPRLHPAFVRMGVREEKNGAGAFLLRRIVYPLPRRHGRYGLEELLESAPLLHPMACRQNGRMRGSRRVPAEPADVPVPEATGLLFLDTETTGLGVGAGNVPFMVGIGRYAEGAFVVEQSLIRHPGEERAMLAWLLSRFRGVMHLVTYNGRSFDWPVLAGRFILNGWRRSGPEPGHLDFLHPSRALWKNTLPTCRLGTVEEERLGIVREADVPGTLAPELYMRFLRDGDAEHLSGVYVHNEQDILTLASLAVHFTHLLGGRLGTAAPEPTDAEERLRTGIWLEQHGRTDEARKMFDLLASDPEAGPGGEIGWRLALAAKYKRLGSLERALPMWERAAELAETATWPNPVAHVELAMYYEHSAKDYGMALRHAETALTLWNRRHSALRASPAAREERARLEKRIARLHRKLLRSPGNRTADGPSRV